jgi:molybdopterin-synthase adenylyltransferase
MLTREETERYDRQLCMEGIGEGGQERLKQAHVFLAGAGGLGSIVAMLLASAGVGRIRIVDDGVVELSNLNRQILYGTEDLGKPKTACAKRILENLNPHVKIEALSETIQEANVDKLVGSCDIIIDALDNYAARYLLNRVAFQRRISLVHGAVEEFRGQATTLTPGKTICLECLVPAPPQQRTQAVLGATCGVIASIQAGEAVKHMVGIGGQIENRLLVWDGLEGEMESFRMERNPACPLCGTSYSVNHK